MKLDTFTLAYVRAALWSSTDESRDDGGDPLDSNYCVEDIDADTLAAMVADCAAFQDAQSSDLAEIDDEQAGHDYWLTRNGHGCGFWDRDLGATGERLSDACREQGGYILYVGDDGRVHGCRG